jgi:hypothetical protein
MAAAHGEVAQNILDCLSPPCFQDIAKRAIEMPQGLTVAPGNTRTLLLEILQTVTTLQRYHTTGKKKC